MLDWGCGNGRVYKYFSDKNQIYGVDINKEGINWCLENISSNFFRFPTRPASPF